MNYNSIKGKWNANELTSIAFKSHKISESKGSFIHLLSHQEVEKNS